MKATEINASLIGKNVKHNTTDDILKIFGVAMNDADAHDFQVFILVCTATQSQTARQTKNVPLFLPNW